MCVPSRTVGHVALHDTWQEWVPLSVSPASPVQATRQLSCLLHPGFPIPVPRNKCTADRSNRSSGTSKLGVSLGPEHLGSSLALYLWRSQVDSFRCFHYPMGVCAREVTVFATMPFAGLLSLLDPGTFLVYLEFIVPAWL